MTVDKRRVKDVRVDDDNLVWTYTDKHESRTKIPERGDELVGKLEEKLGFLPSQARFDKILEIFGQLRDAEDKLVLNLDEFAPIVSSKNTARRVRPGLGFNVTISDYVRWDGTGVEFSSIKQGCWSPSHELMPVRFDWGELEAASASGKDFHSKGVFIPKGQFRELLALKDMSYEAGDKAAVRKMLKDLSSKR